MDKDQRSGRRLVWGSPRARTRQPAGRVWRARARPPARRGRGVSRVSYVAGRRRRRRPRWRRRRRLRRRRLRSLSRRHGGGREPISGRSGRARVAAGKTVAAYLSLSLALAVVRCFDNELIVGAALQGDRGASEPAAGAFPSPPRPSPSPSPLLADCCFTAAPLHNPHTPRSPEDADRGARAPGRPPLQSASSAPPSLHALPVSQKESQETCEC